MVGSGAVTLTKCPLSEALDLGLKITRAGVVASVGELLGAEDIELGFSGFDDAFAVRGDERERVLALIDRDVRAALIDVDSATLTVDDTMVAMHSRSEGEDESTLELAMRQAIRIASAIDAAAKDVSPASALRAHHEALVAFATRHALLVTPTPLTVDGTKGPCRIRARVTRINARERMMSLTVDTQESLGAELGVMSKRSFVDRILHADRFSEVETGDEAFEAAFEAHAKDTERARIALNANVRSRLLELARYGAVFFDDRNLGLQAEPEKLEPSALETILDSMRAIVEARYEDHAQPYR